MKAEINVFRTFSMGLPETSMLLLLVVVKLVSGINLVTCSANDERGMGHLARNCIVRPRRKDAPYLQTQLLIAQKEEAGIQLQAEEFDLIASAGDLDEIEEVKGKLHLDG
ncbi:hypothetical protein Tco_0776190 [Tanacetum coccineum]